MNKLISISAVALMILGACGSAETEQDKIERRLVGDAEANTHSVRMSECDTEVNEFTESFNDACVFSPYTCKLARNSHSIYRENDTHVIVGVPFSASLPENYVAKWCGKMEYKSHIDFVRFPDNENRVFACVRDDYSPAPCAQLPSLDILTVVVTL
jgi:hypothetical protein